jgi:ketosteroid isomerase-like protein
MMSIEEISAHLEIRQLLNRYCRGVDRGDIDLIKSVYHPDAIDDHGPWVGPGVEFADAIVPMLDGSHGIGQHHITNVLIELDGSKAAVESYFLGFHPDKTSDGRVTGLTGRYLDRFERRNGEWRIAHRKVVLDWAAPPNVESDLHKMFPNVESELKKGTPNGKRREADPSHGLFSHL